MRECQSCSWKGPEHATYHPKHIEGEMLCPECNDCTEECRETCCTSCGELFSDHGGLVKTCLELQAARAEIERIRGSLAALREFAFSESDNWCGKNADRMYQSNRFVYRIDEEIKKAFQ